MTNPRVYLILLRLRESDEVGARAGIQVTTGYRWWREVGAACPCAEGWVFPFFGGAGWAGCGRSPPVRGGCPGGRAGPDPAAGLPGRTRRCCGRRERTWVAGGPRPGGAVRGGAAGREGPGASRAARKRALTAESSSRWAGAITRTSEDAGSSRTGTCARSARACTPGSAGSRPGWRSRRAERRPGPRLRDPCRAARQDDPAQGAAGPPGPGGAADRGRAGVGDAGRGRCSASARTSPPPGCRGPVAAGMGVGPAVPDRGRGGDKVWGNETIRRHPDEGWLEVKLPVPLAHLANRPHCSYRLSCPVEFSYRGGEAAAQAATGAIRYDIALFRNEAGGTSTRQLAGRPGRARILGELRRHPVVAVDVNRVIWPSWGSGGMGTRSAAGDGPARPGGAARREPDGRLRDAITGLVGTARAAPLPGDRGRRPGLRRGPRGGTGTDTAPGQRAARGEGVSAAWSPACQRANYATGWSR